MGVGGDGVKLMKSGFIGQRMQQEGISGLQVSTNKPEVKYFCGTRGTGPKPSVKAHCGYRAVSI